MVFGGASTFPFYCMYLLNEEGELVQDKSADPVIPVAMSLSPFVVKGGKVYTITAIYLEQGQMGIFDGEKWSPF